MLPGSLAGMSANIAQFAPAQAIKNRMAGSRARVSAKPKAGSRKRTAGQKPRLAVRR